MGILNEAWQAYALVRDGMDPGGMLPRAVVRPGSAAMRTTSPTSTLHSTRAQTRAVLRAVSWAGRASNCHAAGHQASSSQVTASGCGRGRMTLQQTTQPLGRNS